MTAKNGLTGIKPLVVSIVFAILPAWSHPSGPRPFHGSGLKPSMPNTATITITGQSAGATPFISNIFLTISDASALGSIQFVVTPKPGSVTRPVSATYFSDYLQSRGYLNPQNGQITLKVFGLYANYLNTVTLNCCFTDGSSQQQSVIVPTGPFSDPCGYTTPTVVQPRTNNTDLSYDYIMLKSDNCTSQSPTIIDTDGAVRWVGTAGVGSFSSIFLNNGFYIASNPSGSVNVTGITRMELDGTFSFVKDYSALGVTATDHHNIDPGKQGMILEVDTTTQTESVIMEVDTSGTLLQTWNLANIISAAMTAGGDDPTQFVHAAPYDWFHNNAVTYRKSDDSLVVSSRENFVICIDYQTSAIKWILGDNTKKWYQFPSLRQYALTLSGNSLPPIGQHAVSFTQDDNLLLFDDGKNSLNQTPAGATRNYSTPRKYQINSQTMVATEVWNYPRTPTVYSAFCSSVYEDAPLNYLVDYSLITELLGLNASGVKVFDYSYPPKGCNLAWNAIPVHLEHVLFTGPATSVFGVTGIVNNGSNYVVSFPAVAGNTYRLEYKDALTDATWLMVSDYIAACSGMAQISDTSAGPTQRFYRVRPLP